ncbi:MAG: hypothetical protein ACKVS6_15770 [Planctomycetota bacterium]
MSTIAFSRKLFITLVSILTLAPASFANDVTYKNDSIAQGGNGAVQAGFAKNEIALSVFTVPPSDGVVFIREVRVIIQNALGLNTPRKCSVHIYSNGGPNPGLPRYSSPVLTFLPGEDIVDVSVAKLEYSSGQTFSVGVKFEEDAGLTSLTSVVTDTNGIQAGKNLIYAIPPSAWQTAESAGITGDFGIRAVVTTNGPVHYGSGVAGSNGMPTIDTTGVWKVGNTNFSFEGTKGPSNSTAYLGVSEAAANIAILGIVVWIDPATMFSLTAPTNAAGAWTLPVAIPNNPLIVNQHFFAQIYFVDAAGPQGLTCTDALDILIVP